MKNKREILSNHNLPEALGPYSQATRDENYIFFSGQLPIDSKTSKPAVTIEEQVDQILSNISNALKELDSDLSNVMKVTVFTTSLENLQLINKVYERYFNDNPPARSAIEVTKLPNDVQVMLDFQVKIY